MAETVSACLGGMECVHARSSSPYLVRTHATKPTSAVDLVVASFSTLAPEEQEEAYAKVHDLRLTRLAGENSEMGHYLNSLRRVADIVDDDLTPQTYRQARRTLLAEGEEVIELNAVIRYFGSWRAAKEAVGLAEVTTPLKIEARFRSRLVGKVHHYRLETLRETLERCVRDLGHVPLIVEYELWRQRELELAKTRGERLFLPSDSPYRRRWGSWEAALLALGFAEQEIQARLEPGREASSASLERFQFKAG
jgi:hypothetical protein